MSGTKTQAVPAAESFSLRRGRVRVGERTIEASMLLSALVSVLVTFLIVLSIFGPTIDLFRKISIVEFFTSTTWSPLFVPPEYGVWPLVTATLTITVIAMLVAAPLGLASALCLSEYAHPRVRKVLKPILEILAGVPTVVFGFFALAFVTPQLQRFLPGLEVFNGLAAGLVMGVMIVPTIASLAEDAMTAVPNALRQGAYALGSTRKQVSVKVVIPAAISGIMAAFVLGISRAVGETMIVTIASGSQAQFTLNPLVAMQTMTAYIAQAGTGDVPIGSIKYDTIFAVGALLFLFTFTMNMISIHLVRKYRQAY